MIDLWHFLVLIDAKISAVSDYLAALALSLTIPDICGKAEFPEYGNTQRYIEWYMKYIGQYEKKPLPIKALQLPDEDYIDLYIHPPYLSGEVV